jgi:hypothetical protein
LGGREKGREEERGEGKKRKGEGEKYRKEKERGCTEV